MRCLAENWVFTIFSKSNHFKAEVSVQLLYKCENCGNFGVKEKSLFCLGAKMEL